MMHYCIASKIADKMGFNNRNEFMLGGIAPDIHGLMGVSKGVTHFKDIARDGESYINYLRFYETYKDKINQPFYLGYLCHLISDVVWLELYFQKVKCITPNQWKEQLQVAYRDFRRLNGRIVIHYSLKIHDHTIPNVNIEGYDLNYLPALLELLREDFSLDADVMNQPLDLFKNDNSEIINYIDKSIQECMSFLATKNLN